MIIYVGTYTQREAHAPYGHGDGIYVFDFDEDKGLLTRIHDKAFNSGVNPTFFCISDNRKWLYSSSEDYGAIDGRIFGFRVVDNFSLERIEEYSVHGIGPCYQTTAFDDTVLLSANYFTGSVTSFKIDPKTGSLTETSHHKHDLGSGAVMDRQETGHCHCFALVDDWAFVSDLGCDRIYKYKLDPDQGLENVCEDAINWVCLPEGSGPRHISIDQNNEFMYVSCELSSQVCVFKIEASNGGLQLIQIIDTLPKSFIAQNTNSHNVADIHLGTNGRNLYVSNRAHHSITEYFVSDKPGSRGMLEFLNRTWSRGKVPRNFLLTPDGQWALVANQDTDNIVVFRINQINGKLIYTGHEVECPSPVVLKGMEGNAESVRQVWQIPADAASIEADVSEPAGESDAGNNDSGLDSSVANMSVKNDNDGSTALVDTTNEQKTTSGRSGSTSSNSSSSDDSKESIKKSPVLKSRPRKAAPATKSAERVGVRNGSEKPPTKLYPAVRRSSTQADDKESIRDLTSSKQLSSLSSSPGQRYISAKTKRMEATASDVPKWKWK